MRRRNQMPPNQQLTTALTRRAFFGRGACGLGSAALIFVLLLAASASAAGDGSFTLDQVLSSPFPSTLVASPDGAAFAWVLDEQGSRNIWIAERK